MHHICPLQNNEDPTSLIVTNLCWTNNCNRDPLFSSYHFSLKESSCDSHLSNLLLFLHSGFVKHDCIMCNLFTLYIIVAIQNRPQQPRRKTAKTYGMDRRFLKEQMQRTSLIQDLPQSMCQFNNQH